MNKQAQFSLVTFIEQIDCIIAEMEEAVTEAERITDSLRGEEEYDEEFHYAYEQSLEAMHSLVQVRQFKEFMLGIADHICAKESGQEATLPDQAKANELIHRLDEVIDELRELVLISHGITEDLTAQEVFSQELDDAQEQYAEASDALSLGKQLKEFMLSLFPKKTKTA